VVAPGASWMPIRELSRRLGVSTDLLRKWELRYAVLHPQRTPGNQRLYSRVDEARARVMLRHLQEGMPAAQAAELAIATRFRIAADATATATATANANRIADARAALQVALERYDETAADLALEKVLAQLTATAVIRDVLLPYLHALGERWANGAVSVAQEHFVSAFMHSRLLALSRGWDRGLGPRALLACAPDEHHTFGLIAFGIALHQLGWRITYLGANTPIAAVGQAAARVQPSLTAIAAHLPGRLEPILPQLRDLSAHRRLALGGGGADRKLADRCGALHLPNDPITAADVVFV
jgi:MerR family transcriptional regulator, light-induced transcriptional regulator